MPLEAALTVALGVSVVALLLLDARWLKRYSAVLEQVLPIDYTRKGRGFEFEHAGLKWVVFFGRNFSWQVRIVELIPEKFSVWSRSFSSLPPANNLYKTDGMEDYYLMVDAAQYHRFVVPVRERLDRLRGLGPFIGMATHFLNVTFLRPPRDVAVVKQQLAEAMELLLEWRRLVYTSR